MASYRRQVALDESLSDAQRGQLIAAREAEMEVRRDVAQQELYRGEQEQAFDLFRAENEARQEMLSITLEGVQGSRERRAAELRMLQLQREMEEAQLDLILATKDSASAEYSNAFARKQQLAGIYAARVQGVERNSESPLQRYARGLNRTDGQISDQVEALVVDKLQQVEDGITDALSKAIGTKDPLITGLIRLLIQVVLMKPIANALSSAQGMGAGGIGGTLGSILTIFTTIGKLLGFESGGYTGNGATNQPAGVVHGKEFVMNAATVRRVGRGNLEAIQSGFPLGQTRAARHSAMVQKVFNINVSADNSVTPAGFAQSLATDILREAQRMDAQTARGVIGAVPQRFNQFQNDGT
jgi:hypothetical protein